MGGVLSASALTRKNLIDPILRRAPWPSVRFPDVMAGRAAAAGVPINRAGRRDCRSPT